MKAVVFTLGCKVNDVESGSIIRGLKDMGWEVSRELSPADLYIINTCAVTAEAERKSRQTIARAQKFNPNAKVLVCGCASQKNAKSFLEKDGVFAVVGAKGKNRILEIVESGFDKRFQGEQVCDEMAITTLSGAKKVRLYKGLLGIRKKSGQTVWQTVYFSPTANMLKREYNVLLPNAIVME